MKSSHQELPPHTEQQPAESMSNAAALTRQQAFALNGLIQAVQEIHIISPGRSRRLPALQGSRLRRARPRMRHGQKHLHLPQIR
ncbi:hypothetical protein [Methylobacillus sp.]|uniref:hypothetical protein n=1 Tax=Methylobacillus sp. TaxID=56818 RepID=UPI002FE28A28